jgi:hypothetical protein
MADLPNAWVSYEAVTHFWFNCKCGQDFALRKTNSFVSYEDIKCPDCKRLARLAPHIGERYVFRRVKWDAKKAGRSFNLSFEWFIETIQLPCHYCNRSRVNKVDVASKITGEYLLKDFRYNGLDRVDNAVGYEESNCVPCCVVCNRAKNSMPYNDFMDYVKALVNHQSSMGDNHVTNGDSIQDNGIPYQGRHRKTGNDPVAKELPKDSISVSTTQFWPHIYYGSDGEVWYTVSGGPYRKLERTL